MVQAGLNKTKQREKKRNKTTTRIRVIGKGAFGEAVLVRHKEDRRRYVAKEINLATLSAKEREEARHEILVLGQLDHPNIVKLHESLIVCVCIYTIISI